jgi:hypothetical protein
MARTFLTNFLAHSAHTFPALLTKAVSTRRTDPNLDEPEITNLDQAAALIETLSRNS